jgi:hypothetical protein
MAGEDPRYTAFLRKQPCAKCFQGWGIEVHHPLWATTYSDEEARPAKAIPNAKKGKGQRCHDHFALPLCLKCHVPGIHEGGGHFSGMSVEEREAWEREQIPVHRNRYAMQCPEPIASPTPAGGAKRKRVGDGWTVSMVIDWLRKEAPTRPAPVAAALDELRGLIEKDTL